jgi:hypothetical protein
MVGGAAWGRLVYRRGLFFAPLAGVSLEGVGLRLSCKLVHNLCIRATCPTEHLPLRHNDLRIGTELALAFD